MLYRLAGWMIGVGALVVLAGLIFIITTAAHGQPRPVQLWTLWATDDAGLPVRALLRFTNLDGCYGASLRHGLTTGETATCLPYRIGDFKS